MTISLHHLLLVPLLLTVSPFGTLGAAEKNKTAEHIGTSTKEYLTVPSVDSKGYNKTYGPNHDEISVTPGPIDEGGFVRNLLITILQNLRSQSWKSNLKNITSEILQHFVIPVVNSSNLHWVYNESVNTVETMKLYFSEENLGWIYNATLNAVDAAIPPLRMDSFREAYNETMNAVDTYFLSPKRVLYTALAVSVAMNPTVVSWFQAIVATLVGLVDNTLFVVTGRGLSRSFWSAYPELRYPEYSSYSYQRSASHTVSDTVVDLISEVATAVIEYVGDLYLQ